MIADSVVQQAFTIDSVCWHCSRYFCYRQKVILFLFFRYQYFPLKVLLQRPLSLIYEVHRNGSGTLRLHAPN